MTDPIINSALNSAAAILESPSSFRLVKGNGGDVPGDQLVGNGRAVYAVNMAGQKFHIKDELANKMVAGGIWKEPETLDQAQVDAMQNGSSVGLTHLEQLRSINIGASSEFSHIEHNGIMVNSLQQSGSLDHESEVLASKLYGSGAFNVDENRPDSLKQTNTVATKGIGGVVDDPSSPAISPSLVGYTPQK